MTLEILPSVLIILLSMSILALAIILLIFWIFMIIDVAKRKFKDESEKIVWILVIVLAGWIGALIYYLVIKVPADKKRN